MARPYSAFAAALLAIAVFSLAGAQAAYAAGVIASNSTGSAKDSFYTNETVYASSDENVTASARAIRLYVVADSNSWENGTAFSDARGSYGIASTNATGHLQTTALWTNPAAGAYDVVADVDADGKYNSTVDAMDSLTTAGFTAVASPSPTLAVAAGAHNPADHDWPLGNQSHGTIMHFNVTAGAAQSVLVRSLSVAAYGTGNDLADVKVAYFAEDLDNNGLYTAADSLLGYGVYTRDNGTITFELSGGYEIAASASLAFLMAYDMKAGSQGSTYGLDVTAIEANGTATLDEASVSGLPFKSAAMTLGGAVATTTTTAPAATTTTLPGADECQTNDECPQESCSNLQKSQYECKLSPATGVRVCAATIEAVQCCGDGDCGEGQACTDYACAAAGFRPEWLGGEIDYALFGGSAAVVIGGAVAVLFYLKNRKQTPWKGGASYERERGWRSLRDKWKRRDNREDDE